MKKPTITINIIKEDIGYSANATALNKFIGTQGDDFDALKANILEAVNLAFEEDGFSYLMDEIVFTPFPLPASSPHSPQSAIFR